jgi:hypothetical protein
MNGIQSFGTMELLKKRTLRMLQADTLRQANEIRKDLFHERRGKPKLTVVSLN